MFIPHRRIAVFLMAWLTMIAFTATLYMFDLSLQTSLVQAQASVSVAEPPAMSLPLALSQGISASDSLEQDVLSIEARMAQINSRLQEQRERAERPPAGECQERQLVNNQLIQPILRASRTLSSAQAEDDEKAKTTPSRPAITCTVTSTADSGEGSLRQCLQDAAQDDTINFDPAGFPPTKPATITLSSPLPKIVADGLMIDGRSAGVILNGRELFDGTGLVVDGADRVTIQGLQLLYFPMHGIEVSGGATNTTIGGQTEESRNVISGNARVGVALLDDGTSNNQIEGNYIGTDATGTEPLPNTWGVAIVDAQNNIVGSEMSSGGNLISGNEFGVQIELANASGNRVVGNYIGTDLTGNTPLSNNIGVVIFDGSHDNQVGGASELEKNLISSNTTANIWIQEASENRVLGNYIGTDLTGKSVLTSSLGILIGFGSENNQIGGANEGERNLISGHLDVGIKIQNSNTSGNRVLGNYIGTDSTGTAWLGNLSGVFIIFARNNQIGGAKEGEGNLISGNINGVDIACPGTNGNQLLGNYIGPDFTGTNRLGGLGNGVGIRIEDSATQNQVGGEEAGARNLISGNILEGISISGSETSGNQVLGNYIGTNITATAPLSNAIGISINDGAKNNVIGGASHNLISGNTTGISISGSGTTDNQVLGNYIGTDLTGNAPLANLAGVDIDNGARDNVVGGETENARNLISGNRAFGVSIGGSGTNNNQVVGNYIGTDRTGTEPLGDGNLAGVIIGSGAASNFVGSNLISGNYRGILIGGDGTNNNQVQGNYIGTDLTGAAPLGNKLQGVVLTLYASSNTIGISNTIAYNGIAGIRVDWETTSGNTITRNIVRDNNGPPISSDLVPLAAPTLQRYSESNHMLSGRACAGCRVEVFANPTEEPAGSTFLLEVTADAEGAFTAMITVPADSPYLSATVTDLQGTTSSFSDSLCTTCVTDDSFTLYLPTILR